MKSLPSILIPFIVVAFATPLLAQETVGGEWYDLHTYEGIFEGDHYGKSIDTLSDINGDGWKDWIIGAPGAENSSGNIDAGIARVYSGKNGKLLYAFQGGGAYDHMGTAVGSPRDVDGDGYKDILVSADWEDAGGLHNSGAVYLFSGFNGSLIHRWEGGSIDDNLGTTVSGVGDFNGDTVFDVLVGAPFADNPFTGEADTGAVYVFSGAPPYEPLHQYYGQMPQELHGKVATGVGDLDGDGIYDIIAGSPYAENNQGMPYAGAITMYSGVTGQVIYRLSGQGPYEYFGSSVTRIYDITDDGAQDFLVGAPGASSGWPPNTGAAFLFSGLDGTLLRSHFGENLGDQFGGSIAGVIDIDRDGVKDYAIAADHADPSGLSDAGSVYLYSGATGAFLAQWDGPHDHAFYGNAICGTGAFLANDQIGILIGSEWADPAGKVDAGTVDLKCYDPYLYVDGDFLGAGRLAARISASTGGVIDFHVDFPDEAAGYDYRVLISKSGPAITRFRDLQIPMAMDYLAVHSWFGVYTDSGVFQNFTGTLDAEGKAHPRFGIGPDKLDPWRTYRVVAVALLPGTSTPVISSGPVVIEARD